MRDKPPARARRVKCPYCAFRRDPTVAVCPSCGHLCDEAPPEHIEPPTYPFRREALEAFVYPLTPSGIGAMVLATICFMVLGVLPGDDIIQYTVGWLILSLGGVSFVFYLFAIVQSSAGGDRGAPRFIDVFTDPDYSFYDTFTFGVGGVVLCLGPVLVYEWVVASHGWTGYYVVRSTLMAVGCVYLPMTLLSLAVWRDVEAVSPQLVLPAMVRLPLPTGIAAVILYAGGMIQTLPLWFWGPGQPLGSVVAVHLAAFYLYLVAARIIGVTHWVYRKELGWFEYN